MAITDVPVNQIPPVYHSHVYAAGDAVADLNNWAISIYSPNFSTSHPAFEIDDNNELHYFDGVGFTGAAIPVGWVIVIDPNATILPMSADDFNSQFTAAVK